METKHTPGPWKSEGYGIWSSVGGENRRVACTEYDRGEGPYKVKTEQEAVSNARLIAAAPDLLAALIELLDQAGEVYPHFESERGQANIAQARAAISRATGQEVRP